MPSAKGEFVSSIGSGRMRRESSAKVRFQDDTHVAQVKPLPVGLSLNIHHLGTVDYTLPFLAMSALAVCNSSKETGPDAK